MSRQVERLNGSSIEFVQAMYQEFLDDPDAVDRAWRDYFESLSGDSTQLSSELQQPFPYRSVFHSAPSADGQRPAGSEAILQDRVYQLIHAHRVRGHRIARLNPIGPPPRVPAELNPGFYGLTHDDMSRSFHSFGLFQEMRTLKEIFHRLRRTYCHCVAVQYLHIDDLSIRRWLQQRMEWTENRIELSREEQIGILTRLTNAAIFESFLQKRYVGAKSFSLEGAESLIPLLWLAIEKAADQGIEEIVFGMAHRGRLNVLANIIGKSPRQIFREFDATDTDHGDVKYHLGFSGDWKTASGKSVHLSLCFNPSHLEYVNPVVLGRTRAKQDRLADRQRTRCMSLQIHGDASFAGEGVVQETLNLSELAGYRCGGTLHVIVNNQLGFTTPPEQGRSSTYPTDVAKMLQVPIFHVNGENPEAVAAVIRLAMDFREKFRRDVIVDMYCYRKRGHNESDEPSFTQPQMYEAIAKRKSVLKAYTNNLIQLGKVTPEEAEQIAEKRQQMLEEELTAARSKEYQPLEQAPKGVWKEYFGGPEQSADHVDTHIPHKRIKKLLYALTEFPKSFHLHPTLKRGMERRREMAHGKRPLDWSACEALAFASLAQDGIPIRMSGQDSERGTFSQRHAILHDIKDGSKYFPLRHVDDNQASVEIINSPLSEAGVLGFEYGYSLDCPHGLVLWEAQFGDFGNAAQVIIDQFIASAEEKWGRLSGIVLLLPHGFEGMGPEHSSARLERFLMLSAEDNIQVAVPTTPAQYFHLLRRQGMRKWRKPLVIMTPKSLLRHPQSTSSLEDIAKGNFQPVIADIPAEADKIRRVLLCAGKVYFDLREKRDESKRDDVALIRLEQLYPTPKGALLEVLGQFSNQTQMFWVQEEPENMGAWWHVRDWLGKELIGDWPLTVISRPPSASPATGSKQVHEREQQQLVDAAFSDLFESNR